MLTWLVSVYCLRYILVGHFTKALFFYTGCLALLAEIWLVMEGSTFLFLQVSISLEPRSEKGCARHVPGNMKMKKILLFAAALCLSVLSFAQIQVATLQHGDSIRVFYYADAFVNAYNAAVPGDVISLSAGSFTTCTIINKDSLTIRGAGMDQTFLTGSFYLGASSSGTDYIHTITMEGVHCGSAVYLNASVEVHYTNVYFSKYNANDSGTPSNVLSGQFVNCRLDDFIADSDDMPMFINCIVNRPDCRMSSFVNCVVKDCWFGSPATAAFINSVVVSTSNLPSTVLAQNCIGIRGTSTSSSSIFSSCTNLNSRMVADSVFSDFTLDYMNPERYVLTDSAQAAYLGTDGTQVGLYGGYCPWTSSLPYPVVSRMNVARQTTADGRLSVDIQVGYRQESDEDNE